MRLTTLHILAGLAAAVALLFAFIAAGAGAAAFLIAVGAAALLVWLVYSLARRRISRTRNNTA
ncbi:hypothetical protein [Brevundimonas balnearis]|uniref:Uncharacterized protein n=1 Tax=Brevundimonas balnearis TaxID=1572858 RepID=A0ABV6R056_9CAUL